MALIVKQNNSTTPDGKYFAILIGVYDIGTQPSDKYAPTHQVVLQWELHNKRGPVTRDDGSIVRHSQYFGFTFGVNSKTKEKSALRKIVEGMLDRAFTEAEAKRGYDLFELIDVGSRIQVLDGRITAISPLDEDDRVPETTSDSIAYELDPSKQIPASVPEWLVKAIKRSHEWVKAHGEGDDAPAGNGKPATSATKKAPAKAGKAQAVPVGPNADDDDDDPAF